MYYEGQKFRCVQNSREPSPNLDGSDLSVETLECIIVLVYRYDPRREAAIFPLSVYTRIRSYSRQSRICIRLVIYSILSGYPRTVEIGRIVEILYRAVVF